jgi:hypothetical protein
METTTTQEIITTVLPEFTSVNEGKTFMETYEYPCAFSVKNVSYTFEGNTLIPIDPFVIYTTEVFITVSGYGDDTTTPGVIYVQDNILKYNKIIYSE